ncbi:hypothetical protein U2065_14695, partial [Listeria monocytogenes]|uniref:hypothetical protein n=1 Tax=Listeria monocytogenes TaxID=1639 RepID=UPI002FDBF247
ADDALTMGETVALPPDFEPQRSAPAPLDTLRTRSCPPCTGDCNQGDDCDAWEPMPVRDLWERVLGPALLLTALGVALGSCAFMGWGR